MVAPRGPTRTHAGAYMAQRINRAKLIGPRIVKRGAY